jgi:hypothetical protein
MHQRGAAAAVGDVLYSIYAAQLSADEKRERKKKRNARGPNTGMENTVCPYFDSQPRTSIDDV